VNQGGDGSFDKFCIIPTLFTIQHLLFQVVDVHWSLSQVGISFGYGLDPEEEEEEEEEEEKMNNKQKVMEWNGTYKVRSESAEYECFGRPFDWRYTDISQQRVGQAGPSR
jgi:hypothetical protein